MCGRAGSVHGSNELRRYFILRAATLRSMGKFTRFIFWDFKRGSWQYDVVVGLILVFIFVTPRSFFRDQPKPASIVMLPAHQGFLLETKLLDNVASAEQSSRATQLVNQRFKTHVTITRVEPVYEDPDANPEDQQVTGYLAFPKP